MPLVSSNQLLHTSVVTTFNFKWIFMQICYKQVHFIQQTEPLKRSETTGSLEMT